MNKNLINKDTYLIDQSLQFSLQDGKLYVGDKYTFLDNKTKVYFVIIKVLNKNQKILIYNYISYPIIFYVTLIHFLHFRNNIGGIIYNEPGSFTTITDYNILNVPGNEYTKPPIKMDYRFVEKYLFNYNSPITNIEIFRILNRVIIGLDIDTMTKIVDIAFKHDYIGFIKEILGSLDFYDKLVKDLGDDKNIIPLSIINGCIFIVDDLDKLIGSIRKNYTISAGPQASRGQINSMSSSLSLIDSEYRRSLYNHNSYHIHMGNITPSLRLTRDKFSFNNIHMNLTGVRYITTKSKNDIKNKDDLLQIAFRDIDDILKKKNSVPLDVLQREIEILLYEGQTWFNKEFKKSESHFVYNTTTYNFLSNSKNNLKNLLSQPDGYKGNTKTHGTEFIGWFIKILNKIGVDKTSDFLIQYFLHMTTNESKTIDDVQTPGIPTLVCYSDFGKRIVNYYFYSKYVEYNKKNKNNDMSFSEFLSDNDEYNEVYGEDISFNARVGGFFVYALFELKLISFNYDYKVGNEDYKHQEYVRLTTSSRKIMRSDKTQILFDIPSKLPMIIPPKEYIYIRDGKHVKLGGYLLNDDKYVQDMFIDKVGYGKKTILKNKSVIINMINGLSRTPYKINTNTLNYIYKYGVEKNIITDDKNEQIRNILDNPFKYNKKIYKSYLSTISIMKLEKNILSIAELFSDMDEIYFPVRMDQRTRIYCITDYFDYQKNDIAKGLISFATPGKLYKTDIDEIKYFKAYGANMFGNNLDKKSLNFRVEWVDNNTNVLLDFENNNLVNKAENKTCFVSFCFEYKRFIEFMSDSETNVFYTYLPIQLDATCNGYQHLSLLTREKNLFGTLNLASSTHDNDPDDFYTYMLNLTTKYMESVMLSLSETKNKTDKQIKTISSYDKLLKVNFDRSMVKNLIMIMSYNASIPTIVNQLITNLEQVGKNGRTIYYGYKKNLEVELTRNDLVAFVMAIKLVINKESPRIAELSKYLDNIVSICTKLNMPIPWLLPHKGAEIRQSYEVEKSHTFKAFFFVNTRYTFKKYQRGVYDLTKQKRATMPNLIHSLDASTIAMLYSSLKSDCSLYTIHDCFGVTADNVPKLILKLKLVYIQLYSSAGYLKEFDRFLKESINKTFGDAVYKMGDNFISIPGNKKNKTIDVPNINKVLDNNISIDCVKESSNIIV